MCRRVKEKTKSICCQSDVDLDLIGGSKRAKTAASLSQNPKLRTQPVALLFTLFLLCKLSVGSS